MPSPGYGDSIAFTSAGGSADTDDCVVRLRSQGSLPLFLFLLAAIGLFGVPQLLFHLELEVVGGLAELVHELADLAADLRQAARPEDHERHAPSG